MVRPLHAIPCCPDNVCQGQQHIPWKGKTPNRLQRHIASSALDRFNGRVKHLDQSISIYPKALWRPIEKTKKKGGVKQGSYFCIPSYRESPFSHGCAVDRRARPPPASHMGTTTLHPSGSLAPNVKIACPPLSISPFLFPCTPALLSRCGSRASPFFYISDRQERERQKGTTMMRFSDWLTTLLRSSSSCIHPRWMGNANRRVVFLISKRANRKCSPPSHSASLNLQVWEHS